MTKTFRSTRSFAEIADLIAAETTQPTDAFATAFGSELDGVRIACADDEGQLADMPDPLQVQLATELIITTVFDVMRDTRLERYAEQIARGIVTSLHSAARSLERQADDAAGDVKSVIREADGSEIGMAILEQLQAKCRELDEASDAIACMRDNAAAAFHTETGKPWSTPRGSVVSSKRTASIISATDYLSARRNRKLDQHDPQGPLVAFSGPAKWVGHHVIYDELDRVRALIPNMVLLTTDLDVGADAIAKAWAAAKDVKVIREDLPKGLGKSAGFVRNDRMLAKRPVDAIICSGSGVQAHFLRILNAAGIKPREILGNGYHPDWARQR